MNAVEEKAAQAAFFVTGVQAQAGSHRFTFSRRLEEPVSVRAAGFILR